MVNVFEGDDSRTACLEAFSSYVRSKHLNMRAEDKISAAEEYDNGAIKDSGNGHYHIGSWQRPEDLEGIRSIQCAFDDKEFNWKIDRTPRTLFLERVTDETKPRHDLEDIEKGRQRQASWMERDFTWGIVREGDTIFASVAYMYNRKVHLNTYKWKIEKNKETD